MMKKSNLLLIGCCLLSNFVYSQTAKKAANENIGTVNYKPIRLLVNIGKTDEEITTNFGLELNAERRLTNYLNYGVGIAYYRVESTNIGVGNSSYPYVSTELNAFEPSLFLTGYLPVNALMGNAEHKDTGFFPHISAGVFYNTSAITTHVTSSSSSGVDSQKSNDSKGGFYNVYGIDYKFKKGLGLSVATQKFKNFWFGINFQFN